MMATGHDLFSLFLITNEIKGLNDVHRHLARMVSLMGLRQKTCCDGSVGCGTLPRQ